MTNLPPGWAHATLGDIADTTLGKMLDRKKGTGKHLKPYLRNLNVQWGNIDLDNVLMMDIPPEEEEIFRLRSGDLLVCEGGEIGRCAIWTDDGTEMFFQKALHQVRPLGGISPDYLRFLLEWLSDEGVLLDFATGTTIKHLPQERLRRLPVPLPPLAEQQRIVANLKDHFSRLDVLAQAIKSSQKKIRELAKKIIIDAVSVAGDLDWKWITVGEAGEVDLGRQRHPDWHSGPNMRPYLRVANVFEDRIDTSDLMEMDFPPDIFDRFRLTEGDILLNEGQSPEYLGRPAMYRGEPKDVAFTNSLLRFRAGPEVDPEWALLVFRRHMHAGRFMQETRITTNIAHLSASRFKSVEFPVPPLEEQREIVKQVARKLADVGLLASQIRRVEERAKALRSRLLADAFSGRLVHRDPTEEPVAELLKRIQTQREALRAKRPRRTARASRRGAGDLAQKDAGGDGFTGAEPLSVPSTTVGASHTGKQEDLFQQEGLTA
ncbi:restriction endonuclease subunit S [Sphaerimonospora cavernae]|uniref:Restriction endonuclease subunit S n=1 Tax=Sphaerimonospora cavernae TaxID=1740611 RepID=A0ABV6TYW7_9ACTN